MKGFPALELDVKSNPVDNVIILNQEVIWMVPRHARSEEELACFLML